MLHNAVLMIIFLPQYQHHWVQPLLVQVHSQSQKIRQLEAEVKAKTLQLQDLLPDNKSENLRYIHQLLGILGLCLFLQVVMLPKYVNMHIEDLYFCIYEIWVINA